MIIEIQKDFLEHSPSDKEESDDDDDDDDEEEEEEQSSSIGGGDDFAGPSICSFLCSFARPKNILALSFWFMEMKSFAILVAALIIVLWYVSESLNSFTFILKVSR